MILYHVDSDEEGQLYQINFWVHAVVIKLLPCFILTVISLWLVREVYSANEHQKKIRVYNACPTSDMTVKRQCKGDKRMNRTTKMLVAVLLLFLVTELPQGILGLMSGLLGRCFFKRCYDLFGELMDALALLNGAINFVLYCSMSRQFRMTFRQMMWRSRLHRWPPPVPSHSDGLNTYVLLWSILCIHQVLRSTAGHWLPRMGFPIITAPGMGIGHCSVYVTQEDASTHDLGSALCNVV